MMMDMDTTLPVMDKATDMDGLRVAFVLPGLHRVNRGAEVAFESIAHEIGKMSGWDVTVIGSGDEIVDRSYKFRHAGAISRRRFERFPRIPYLRSEYTYEELTFVPGLISAYRPGDYDVTVTCSYPYVNWILRARRHRGKRPAHVFVTQNGDWPARAGNREYQFFGCDGLVCINPDYYKRNCDRWSCALIPNGVDPSVFLPGLECRARFGLPESAPVVLMVSALITSKMVLEGIRGAAGVKNLHMIVAGDGPLRDDVERLGSQLMGTRFQRVSLSSDQMPDLYRSVDVFLHMSLDEPFGNVYLEALSTGLPVVAHDSEVTRWIVGEQGILIDTTNVVAVTDALNTALTGEQRDGAASRHEFTRQRYAWPHIAAQYCAFFHQVIEHRNNIQNRS